MSFAPTPPEQQLIQALFNAADPQKVGIINGENAVKILGGAKLPPAVLGEIWAIADSDNNGFLTRKGAGIVLRLIGWAQKGEPVKEELLGKGEGVIVINWDSGRRPLSSACTSWSPSGHRRTASAQSTSYSDTSQ